MLSFETTGTSVYNEFIKERSKPNSTKPINDPIFFLFMRIDIRHESTYINKHTGGKGTCTTCRVVDPVALTPARRVPKGLWGTSWYHLTGQINLTKGLKGE